MTTRGQVNGHEGVLSDLAPTATAMVCTRNRGPAVVTALRSLLGNTHPNFEVIVIDRSRNEATAAQPFLRSEN